MTPSASHTDGIKIITQEAAHHATERPPRQPMHVLVRVRGRVQLHMLSVCGEAMPSWCWRQALGPMIPFYRSQ